jgi:hypothetical protein
MFARLSPEMPWPPRMCLLWWRSLLLLAPMPKLPMLE